MIHEKMNTWLSSPHVTNADKEVIRAYSEKEADDAFFKDIEFGTAGMRGIVQYSLTAGFIQVDFSCNHTARFPLLILLRDLGYR